MLSRKIAWLEAAWIFIISRLVILFITVVASLRMSPPGQSLWLSWLHWDVFAYIGIAEHGYSNLRDTVFFPLWPFLIHGAGALFGASTTGYYIAGLLLTNLLFYFALVIFYCLLSESFDPTVARNSLFYLTFSPYAIFFFVGYTEALFLFLCLAAFFCLQRSHYWLASLCGFLAALTHSQGVLLIGPVAVVIAQRFWLYNGELSLPRKLRACLPCLLIPLGVVVFMLYLGITKHSPLAFSTAESQFWNRHLTFPAVSIIIAIRTFFDAETYDLHLLNLLDIIFVLAPLAILIKGWRGLPLHYTLFALVMILFNMSYPQGTVEPLTAAPRYMLLVFPVFAILGQWGKRPYLDRIIAVCSISIFALNALLFVEHYWVA